MADRKKTKTKISDSSENESREEKKGTAQIRIPEELAHDLNKIAVHKKCKIAELIVPLLGPFVASELELIRLEMNKKAAEKSGRS